MIKCFKLFDYFLLRSCCLFFMDFCFLFGFLIIGNVLVICFVVMVEYLSFVVVRMILIFRLFYDIMLYLVYKFLLKFIWMFCYFLILFNFSM